MTVIKMEHCPERTDVPWRSAMAGRVIAVEVGFESDGQKKVVVDLDAMRAHCRAERVEDLLDDLVMLCEDVLTGLQPDLRIIQGAK